VHKSHNSKLHTFGVIAILEFCPEHNSKSIRATDLKFYTQIDLIEENCSAVLIINLIWTVTLRFFKFSVKAHSGALVKFCDKALVYEYYEMQKFCAGLIFTSHQ